VSPRRLVFVSSLLISARLLGPADAVAAVGAFSLSSPANGAFANATPTLRWGASAGATSYTLTLTPVNAAAVVKAGLTSTSYALAAGEALSEAGSPYTWRVTARDDGGNTLASNTSSFFVDTTPPSDFALTTPVAGAFIRTTGTPLLWNAATDAGSGLSTYHVYIDGALCGDSIYLGFSFLPSTCNPADGLHTWAVSAEDVAGNIKWCQDAPGGVGGRAIQIDNLGPDAGNGGGVFQLASSNIPDQYGFPTDRMVNTGINVNPGDQISITSTGTWCFLSCTSGCYATDGYNDPVNTPAQNCNNGSLIARVGGGSQFKCISKSASFTAGINDTGILELGSNSQLGCNDLTVTATVTGGRSFNLISPAPGAVLNQQFPTFTWQAAADHGSGGVTYQVNIDGVSIGETNQSSGSVFSTTTATAIDRLADGAHTWNVLAVDAAGNSTVSTTRTFTVDTTRPAQFRLSTPGNGTCSMTPTPNLCWNSAQDPGGVATYQLWIDDALAFTTNDPLSTICGTPSAALAPGTHSWYVVAIDRVGNARRSTDTFQIAIDYTPPAAPALLAPANGSSSADPPSFAWAAAADAGGVSQYQVYVDGALAATVTGVTLGWLTPTDLAAGAHSWYVRAIDACGQGTSSAAWTFTTVACAAGGAAHPCPGYNLGLCTPGTRTCTSAGVWSACAGAVGPSAETCNGQDDNCDGVVDEGTNSCGGVCTLPVYLYTPCDGPDADLCEEGVWLCTGRNSMACVETTPVNVEVCNGRDDDCNGVIDDPPVCTAGPPPPDGGTTPDAGAGGASGSGGASGAGGSNGTGGAGGANGTGGAGGSTGAGGALAGGSGGAGFADAGPGPLDAALADGPSAGASGGSDGAAGSPDSGSGLLDGGADTKVGGQSGSGCACATAAPGSAPGSLWLPLMVGLLLTRRRRRRRPQP
jgi:MYXO-CTERM domain-containing protein